MSLGGGVVTSGGWLEVIAGSMFSGKTEELMRRVRRATIARKRVQVFKSHLDDRYAGVWAVSSHDRRTVEAVPVDSSAQILLRHRIQAQVIAIDEAQVLDGGLVAVATSLADRGGASFWRGSTPISAGSRSAACRSSWPPPRWWTSCTPSA